MISLQVQVHPLLMRDYIESAEFDDLLVATIQRSFPPHEHEQFITHYRGLLGAWVDDQRAAERH